MKFKSKAAIKAQFDLPPTDFAALILTHGRPDSVFTLAALKKAGYTGRVVLVIDDEDKTGDQYREKYGAENVMTFSKKEVEKGFDVMDNFTNKSRNGIVWARNAAFDVAEQLGVTYFWQLDDDYRSFRYWYGTDLRYQETQQYNLNAVLNVMLKFYKATPRMLTLAMAQSGEYIGGKYAHPNVLMKRKAMNTFICSTERRFKFIGRINEDVNVYTLLGTQGKLIATTTQVGIHQSQTQANAGGMTAMYVESGTYVKTFYSVIAAPSCVRVSQIGSKFNRIHHEVRWNNCAAKIVPESIRK